MRVKERENTRTSGEETIVEDEKRKLSSGSRRVVGRGDETRRESKKRTKKESRKRSGTPRRKTVKGRMKMKLQRRPPEKSKLDLGKLK